MQANITLKDQISLENKFLDSSAHKYYTAQDTLRKKKQTDQTDSVRYVIGKGISDSAKILEHVVNTQVRGVGAKYNQLLKKVATRIDTDKDEHYQDYKAVAFIGLTVLFRCMGDRTRGANLTTVKSKLAAALESDAKARLFEAAHPGYYFTVMKSMQEQGVTQYDHIHKVIMTKFRDFELSWEKWDIQESNAVSGKVLNAILVAMHEIVFKHTYKLRNKTIVAIDTTVAADDWFAEYEQTRGLIKPTLPPMIIPPINWSTTDSGEIEGGYTTPRMCRALPFIKATSKAHLDYIRGIQPAVHIAAINRMQNTAWEVNTEVLSIQTEIFNTSAGILGIPTWRPQPLLDFPEKLRDVPTELLTQKQKDTILEWKIVQKKIYTKNRLNKSNVLAYKMTLDGATEYNKYDKLYFVYSADFRGRVYCATTGLSPQGDDRAKALLRFHRKVTLGESGIKWLAIHGANTFGYDKVSYEDRIKWVYGIEARLRAVAERPLDTTDFWGSADKPWQFLAFIFEWSKTDYGRDKAFKSKLPVGLDGSCNGIQHYSAILRDSVGGCAVNLVDGQIPSDIYQTVADRLVTALSSTHGGSLKSQLWLQQGITRKLTKKPVMTLPYGATQQSAKTAVYDWLLDYSNIQDDKELYPMAVYLTPILWKSIEQVVIAARAAMVWLKKVAHLKLKQNNACLTWVSPSGFPVFQAYYKMQRIRVRTMLFGDITIQADGTTAPGAQESTTYTIPTDEVDWTRQKSGIAPNFIHSIDSSHMVKTVLACPETIQDFAMIHDDFGTHAGNVQELQNITRQEFCKMYLEHEPLQDWLVYQALENAPETPPVGELDITDVLTSKYFFG